MDGADSRRFTGRSVGKRRDGFGAILDRPDEFVEVSVSTDRSVVVIVVYHPRVVQSRQVVVMESDEDVVSVLCRRRVVFTIDDELDEIRTGDRIDHVLEETDDGVTATVGEQFVDGGGRQWW